MLTILRIPLYISTLVLYTTYFRKGATLRVGGAPPYQPHPHDASGADYVRAVFSISAAPHEILVKSQAINPTAKFHV